MSELIVTEKGLKVSEETPRGNCWVFHRWSRWKVITEGSIIDSETKGRRGQFKTQQRECLRCGKVELETQTIYEI